MMEFKTVLDAISWRTKCPICSNLLEINESGLQLYSRKFDVIKKEVVTKLVWSYGDYALSVVLETNHVNLLRIITSRPSFYKNAQYNPYINGQMFVALGINCFKCHKYSHLFQVIACFKNDTAIAKLDSEIISIENCKNLHEIKNSYASKKTIYNVFTNKSEMTDKNSIIFPLIPLDISNPQKTLDRIKALIPFS